MLHGREKCSYSTNLVIEISGTSNCNSCTRCVCQTLYSFPTWITLYCCSNPFLWRHYRSFGNRVFIYTFIWFDRVTNLVYIFTSSTTYWVNVSFVTVVVMTKNLQNFTYTWILEPTMDLAIRHSIVTSWSVNALLSLWAPFMDCKCQSHLLTHAQFVMNSWVNSFMWAWIGLS